MSSIDRLERLRWEREQLARYAENCPRVAGGHPLVEIRGEGDAPTLYHLTYHCRGLRYDRRTKAVGIGMNFQGELQLDADYPFALPTIILSPLFHPNVGNGVGGGYVCLEKALTEGYQSTMPLAEIVRQVGEMIRLAQYSRVPETEEVYAKLERDFKGKLPVDPTEFPRPAETRAPETRAAFRLYLTDGRVVELQAFERYSQAEIIQEVARKMGLPTKDEAGLPLRYGLRPREVGENQYDLVSAQEGGEAGEEDPAVVGRYLAAVKSANPGVFDFALQAGKELRYQLSFNVETFAPPSGPGGTGSPGRTIYNRAMLRLVESAGQSTFLLTWLTPIFHPCLGQNDDLNVQVTDSLAEGVARLFRILKQLLAYQPVCGFACHQPRGPGLGRAARCSCRLLARAYGIASPAGRVACAGQVRGRKAAEKGLGMEDRETISPPPAEPGGG